ncbi:MAG: L-rhamnonate dehydratase [Chloroflexi bacterium]|nr:L-rhamnonate dehydratase [Chloroflexota bacterium]
MKIKSIEVVTLNLPPREYSVTPRRKSWNDTDEVANPMSGYPHVKRHRSRWIDMGWGPVWVKVTLENGVWGLGSSAYSRPVAAIIEDHLAPQLVGQDGFAIERLSDMMFRLTKLYGSTGLASYAISALDLALWDAKGKALDQPVYSLIGGKLKDRIYCYSTGNDIDWYQELGFTAHKLACPYGPADGLDGLQKNVELIAGVRDQVGDDCEIMLDCWMSLDVDYAVRLAEALRPYRVKWIEECLIPEDFDAHAELRARLPWQTLTAGEHWYTHFPFQYALKHNLVDILQPDIEWVGGLTTCIKIAHAAEAAGKKVIPHTGARTAYGQHFSFAMAAVPWIEYFIGSPPGIPLSESTTLPGMAYAVDGWLEISDEPGFGLGIEEDWIAPHQG